LSVTVDIEPLLDRVQKPARYIGGEVGMVRKSRDAVALHAALCFPDIYEVAESHLGLKILYDLLNREPEVQAERVYAVWPDMAAALEESGRPLFSLETRTPLDQFDLVGFSINHELAYPTVLHMLELGRLPLHAAQRSDAQPLVIAGGPAMCNPEPLAPFLDAVVIGDGEEVVLEISRALIAMRGRRRVERLKALAQIEGVLVPSLQQEGAGPRVRMRRIDDLDRFASPGLLVVPHLRPVHDRAVVEIQRGCTRGCRFCQAGVIYRPLRQRSPQRVACDLERAIAVTGMGAAGLLSLSAGDYGALEPLLDELGPRLRARRVSLSVPSLHVETLSPRLAREVTRLRAGGFTLAPEAGTERLRAVIGKGYAEADLLRATRAAFSAGAKHLKLYFMIGLPTERDEDVVAIAALAERVVLEARRLRRGARATVAISTFIPKPHTPFQWEAQAAPEEVRRRQNLLRRELRGGGRIALRWHDAGMSTVEGVYARGDRRLASVVEGAYRRGARLDAWTEHFQPERHLEALAEAGLAAEPYLAARPLDQALPWDHIDSGVLPKFLRRERKRAYAGELRGDCTMERCLACGVCDFDQVHSVAFMPASDGSVARVEKSLGHRDNRGLSLAPRGGLDDSNDGADADDAVAEEPAAPEERAGRDRPADHRAMVLRLRYAKRAPAIYLSHLETLAAVHRALLRARLPIAFSGGFHATPRVSAPHALTSGVVSQQELIDVGLRTLVPAAEAIRALARELPRGIALLDAVALGAGTPGIGELVAGARYRAQLSVDAAVAAAQLARFEAAETWPMLRQRKGRRRTVDLKALVFDPALMGTALTFSLRLPSTGTVRPAEAVAELAGEGTLAVGGLEKLATLFRSDVPAPLEEAPAPAAEPIPPAAGQADDDAAQAPAARIPG